MYEFVIKILLFVAPMYFANSVAMFLGGKTPIDMNMKFFDNKPIFGAGKTVKGAAFGILAGSVTAVILSALIPKTTAILTQDYVFLGIMLAIGAIFGDMAGSFLKRRFGIDQGKEVIILDQLDFVAGGIIVGSLIYFPSALEIAVVSLFTIIVHKVSNYIAFRIKLKKVPW